MSEPANWTGGSPPSSTKRHQLSDDERERGRINAHESRRARRAELEAMAVADLADQLAHAALRITEALDAEATVYVKDGDPVVSVDYATRLRAAREAFDRVIGRPRQAVELTGEAGQPVEVTIEPSADYLARVASLLADAGALGTPGGPDS